MNSTNDVMRPPVNPPFEQALVDGTFSSDPYRWYAQLRKEAPIYYSETLGQWWVTDSEIMEEVLLSPDRFSSVGFDQHFLERLGPAELDAIPTLYHHVRQLGLVQSDPPDHARMRRAVRPHFTKDAVQRLQQAISVSSRRLLASAAGDFDLVADFARPLPVGVIMELLGVPDDQRGKFPTWSDQMMEFFGVATPDLRRGIELDMSLVEWRGLVRRLLDEKRSEPATDFLSLAASLVDNESLTEEEAVFTCVHLLFAGHETTTGMIANVAYHMLSREDVRVQVARDPRLITRALEETLRFDPILQRAKRAATDDMQFHGCDIKAGDLVVAIIGAVGRDPLRFDEPDLFDLDREARGRGPHFAFGRGIHHCLGAPLARLEITTALEALLEMAPDVMIQEGFEPQWAQTVTLHRLQRLPVTSGLWGNV